MIQVVQAQPVDKGYKVLKLFSSLSTTDISPNNGLNSTEYGETSIDLLNSISLAISTNKYFHEIEIERIKTYKIKDKEVINGVVVRGAETKIIEIQARYSYNLSIKDLNKKSINIGVSFTPYYSRIKTDPLVLSTFSRTTKSFGITSEIIPRIIFDLSDRFVFEMNFLLPITNWNLDQNRVNNPAIPSRQQRVSDSTVNFFPGRYQVSIGIGIKL